MRPPGTEPVEAGAGNGYQLGAMADGPHQPLDRYRAKRDFTRTDEPSGADGPGRTGAPGGPSGPGTGSEPPPAALPPGSETGEFVIQLHDATRTHYDFRLEVGGVLRSWAVPRGPSYDPAEKRLAVPTEDHPFEYREYEGVIPEGSYGAGPSLIWDRGTYVNISHDRRGRLVPLARALEKGHASVWLQGRKLLGGWALTRIEEGAKPAWLLVKRADAAADPEYDVVEAEPRSVVSGLTVEELRARG